MRQWFVVLVAFLAFVGLPAWADEVTVAVAANFSAPAQKLAAAYGAVSGNKVQVVVGSTGKLYAQVKNGAPFHVFLSADDETPARLVQEGSAVPSSQFTYATGRLVLWSKQAGVVDDKGQVLRTDFGRLAIADPKLAPYGAAAMEVLDKLGLKSALQGRIVQGESIAQAYQFVASGNASLGFVAQSQVMVDGRVDAGSAWLVPNTLHSPLRQDAVLLTLGQGHPAASGFLSYLRSEAGRTLIRGYGYDF